MSAEAETDSKGAEGAEGAEGAVIAKVAYDDDPVEINAQAGAYPVVSRRIPSSALPCCRALP